MGRRPNILYLNSHDTGRFIQPMGHAVRTPHIQALADAGVLFRDCHNAGPTCSPACSRTVAACSAWRIAGSP
jgi:arylsulfatase A-like enzyme